jgi:hypothetical protein
MIIGVMNEQGSLAIDQLPLSDPWGVFAEAAIACKRLAAAI